MSGSTGEDVSQQEALNSQGEVVTYAVQMYVDDVNNNLGDELAPDAVTGPLLSPHPVTPQSPLEVTAPAPFTYSNQQEATVISNEYLAQIRNRLHAGYTLEEIRERWEASGLASTINTVTVPQPVDVPVPDDEADPMQFEGESHEFEDETDGEPEQLYDEYDEGMGGVEDAEGGEEEAREFDEEEHWYFEQSAQDKDVTEEGEVGETHGRGYTLDRASFQRRRLNEAGDQSWDYRSSEAASSTSRNPLSHAETNDRHLHYDRWTYKQVEDKKREHDEFAEKLKASSASALEEVLHMRLERPRAPDALEFYAGEDVQMVCTNCLPAHVERRQEADVPFERRIFHRSVTPTGRPEWTGCSNSNISSTCGLLLYELVKGVSIAFDLLTRTGAPPDEDCHMASAEL
eukprot:6491126-Amphidinium_carterae.1